MSIYTKKRSFTIASLNLWRFYDWEKRLPLIISTLKELQPDIIFTQETQRNPAISNMNQIELLNQQLEYSHSQFAVADMKYIQKGVPLEFPVEHGLGILSRFPFSTEIIPLTKAADDKEKRILLSSHFEIGGDIHHLTNLHFSNSDKWAEAHLIETLEIFQDRKYTPILMGDYNIFDLSKYDDFYKKDYMASSQKYRYTSYPSEQATFDYILLPHCYTFQNFQCRQEYLSDHCMIITTISY